jgi:hypothetical protein
MGFLSRLYRAETLDTRFASKSGQRLPDAQPSKWNTPEYYLYYLCFLTIPFLMVKSVYDVSGPWHASYKQYEHLLEPGWIPGRKVDNSDAQYRGFRENIPYMAMVVVLHPILRRVYERFCDGQASTSPSSSSGLSSPKIDSPAAIEARKESRIRFDIGFAVIFLLALHGISAAKVFTILYVNYQVATALPRQYVPAATWIFNLPPETSKAGGQSGNWGDWLDSYGGLIPRWEILFNICVLRLISFNFDYYWSLDHKVMSAVEVCYLRRPHSRVSKTKLTHFRRRTSTLPPTPNAKESTLPRVLQTSASATTSPTSSTRPSTSPAQSSPSTITSPNNATSSPPSTASGSSSTPSASWSVF